MKNEAGRAQRLGEPLSDGLVLAGNQRCRHHATGRFGSDGWAGQHGERVGFTFFLEPCVDGLGNQPLSGSEPLGQIQQHVSGLEVRYHVLDHIENDRRRKGQHDDFTAFDGLFQVHGCVESGKRMVRQILVVDVAHRDGFVHLLLDGPPRHFVPFKQPQAGDGRPPVPQPQDSDVRHVNRCSRHFVGLYHFGQKTSPRRRFSGVAQRANQNKSSSSSSKSKTLSSSFSSALAVFFAVPFAFVAALVSFLAGACSAGASGVSVVGAGAVPRAAAI